MRGRAGPREEGEASPPRSRGGVAGQPGGACADSGGRHGGFEREGQRAGQRGFERRKKRPEVEGEAERGCREKTAKERVGFFNQFIQPEEKEEEEEESKERSKGGGNEGAERRVWEHRYGPGRQGEETGGEKGEEKPGEESTEEEDVGVFEEAQRIRRVGVRGPGVLAAASINKMKKSLVAASGQLCQNRDLAPVGVHYFRTVLQLWRGVHSGLWCGPPGSGEGRRGYRPVAAASEIAGAGMAGDGKPPRRWSCALWKHLR